MVIRNLNGLQEIARKKPVQKLAVAAAEGEHVFKASIKAKNEGIVKPVFIGDKQRIIEIARKLQINASELEIIDSKDQADSCDEAFHLASIGKADIVMKGLVSTSTFLKALLNKNYGLIKNSILSHLAIFETPFYHKILGITDAAINIAPNLRDKAEIIKNAVEAYNNMGVDKPRVGVLAAIENVNPKMKATVHASKLKIMNEKQQIKNCIVDGPLALDNAVSQSAARHKGIQSDVAGDVDILVTPDINSGNILYKSLNFLGGSVCAALVLGAAVPVILTSRADSDQSKYMSIAFAVAIK
jgi:phosphate butyryltransferase